MRNYDYSPAAFDRVILHTNWQGRRVLGTSDGLWGLVDGMNDAGLAISLTFGGRQIVGDGFGLPLILALCAADLRDGGRSRARAGPLGRRI